MGMRFVVILENPAGRSEEEIKKVIKAFNKLKIRPGARNKKST
jgi:hypothetical protein